MKRKSSKQIPDFSSHRQSSSTSAPSPAKDAMAGAPRAQPPRAPAPKPQATSSKSGRRGQ